jgi:N-acetylneuraminic acid mutarotase
VAVGSKVYVFGGWKLAGEGNEGEWHDAGLVLDLAAAQPKWEPIAQPFKKRALALAEADGKIFAMGGMTEQGRPTNEVAIFDIAQGKWSDGPELPKSMLGGFAISAFGANGRAWVTTYEGGLYSAAPGETDWRAEATLTYPRMFHRLLHVGGGEFAAVAGTARGSHVRNVEWIKPGVKGPVVTRVNLPAPGAAKTRQGIFFHNNTLYAFGGNNSVKDHQFAPDNFVNEAFAINLNTLSAERIATLPVKRQSFVTFMTGTQDRFGEKIGYAVGGFWHDGQAALSTSEVLQYSLDADVWEPAKLKLPNALTQFGVAEHGGKIYLFGGMNFDPARGKKERFQESETVWCYDPKPHAEVKEGEKGPGPREFVALDTKLPTKRRAFGAAVLGDKYYIIGGMTKDFEEVDRCDVYDFKTGQWSTIPQPNDVRLAPKLIPLNGKLYLCGGTSPTEQGMARNGSIEEFDPATGTWRTIIEDIGGDLGELQAFAFGHRILLYSVHNDENEIRLVFIEP